jgi:hypothetical protein
VIRSTVKAVYAAIALVLLMPGSGSAGSQVVKVWPGVAPGSEAWTQKEKTVENTPLGIVVFNVVDPTLTAYLPERAKATGTSVLIAPGGAFVALAIDLEGNEVARWLQGKGIAAFVLKYRILERRGVSVYRRRPPSGRISLWTHVRTDQSAGPTKGRPAATDVPDPRVTAWRIRVAVASEG